MRSVPPVLAALLMAALASGCMESARLPFAATVGADPTRPRRRER